MKQQASCLTDPLHTSLNSPGPLQMPSSKSGTSVHLVICVLIVRL